MNLLNSLSAQKGSAIIIFIIVIIILAAGIIGSSIYLKQNDLRFVTKVSNNDSSQRDQIKVSTDINLNLELQNKIIFISNSRKVVIGSSEGKEIQPFSPILDQVNTEYLLADTLPSPALDKLLIMYENPFVGGEFEYYLASLDGKDVRKIDLDKISTSFGKNVIAKISGWSTDGSKLVVVVNQLTGQSGPSNHTVIEYDSENSTTKNLFSKLAENLIVLTYDPLKKFIIYSSLLYHAQGSKAYVINLETNNEKEFNSPTIINSYGNSSEGGAWFDIIGPYFVSSSSPYTDDIRKTLAVYSVSDPTNSIAEIKLEDTNQYFYKDVVWSPDSNYFAIKVKKPDPQNFLLNIYDKNGHIIQSMDLNSTYDLASGSLFSKDGKYFMLVHAADGTNLGVRVEETIYAFEVKTGKVYIKEYKPRDDLRPEFWY